MQFHEIPEDNLSNLAAAEFDLSASRVPSPDALRIVLLGRMASGAAAPADTLVELAGEAMAVAQFGARSMIPAMLRAYGRNHEGARIYGLGIDTSGTAAEGTVGVTGTATAAGVLELRVAMQRVLVDIESGDDADAVATKIAAALAANTSLPVTAAATGGTVTLTAAWDGPSGNDIALAVVSAPAGIAATATAMASGATAPDIAAAIAALDTGTRYMIVAGVNEPGALTALAAEVRQRWGAMRAVDGHVFFAFGGTALEARAFGDGRDNPEESFMSTDGADTPPWELAAAFAGAVFRVQGAEASRYGAEVRGVAIPTPANQPSHAGRNAALRAGVSTYTVTSGRMEIDRVVTTSKTVNGAPDATWRDLTTRLLVSELRADWNAHVAKKFQGAKLASDNALVRPGVRVVTPKNVIAEALAWAREKVSEGKIENFEAFRDALLANRPNGDPNRINALLSPDLVNKLVTIATLIQPQV